MIRATRISIAVACALGVTAALAQTVQRGDTVVGATGKAAPAVVLASTQAPIKVAQAGGAATGATAGGTAAGMGLGTTLVVVGAAVATIAVTVDSGSAVSH